MYQLILEIPPQHYLTYAAVAFMVTLFYHQILWFRWKLQRVLCLVVLGLLWPITVPLTTLLILGVTLGLSVKEILRSR